MTRFLGTRLVLVASCAVFAAGLLLAPLPAAAQHGIKCGWVQTGVNTYTWVCGVKGP